MNFTFSFKNPFARRQPATPIVRADTSTPAPQREGQPVVAPSYFEALTVSDTRSRIPFYGLAVRRLQQTFLRLQLAFLGEYLYDNDGNVGYAVDQIANYSAPIVPMACTADQSVNKAYEDYFEDWCKRADFKGQHNFAMLQRLACKAIDTTGDVLPLMDAAHGFPQVRLIEGSRILSLNAGDKNADDGVKTDSDGVVLGYYVVDPVDIFGTILINKNPPKFIPASEAFLLYDPDHVNSCRGYSPIRRGSNDVRDAKDIKGFEKLATKISAAMAAVIEGADTVSEDDWIPPQGQSPQSQPPEVSQQTTVSKTQLLGGEIPVLPPGQKFNQLRNDRPGERIVDILDYLAGCFVAGIGLPPGFIVDQRMTGPGQRGINGKAQRKFDKRQETLANFVEWVWVRVIAWGITHDGLPAVPGWNKCEWQGPAKVSIDDGQDANAWREDFVSGLMNRREHFGNRNRNWQRETDQGFAEDEYILSKANALAKQQNVPVTVILSRWGYQTNNTPQDASKTNPHEDTNGENHR